MAAAFWQQLSVSVRAGAVAAAPGHSPSVANNIDDFIAGAGVPMHSNGKARSFLVFCSAKNQKQTRSGSPPGSAPQGGQKEGQLPCSRKSGERARTGCSWNPTFRSDANRCKLNADDDDYRALESFIRPSRGPVDP